jgi:hypothetical protein
VVAGLAGSLAYQDRELVRLVRVVEGALAYFCTLKNKEMPKVPKVPKMPKVEVSLRSIWFFAGQNRTGRGARCTFT